MDDAFSALSEKINGLDMAFGGVGLLWLLGMVVNLTNLGVYDFLIILVVWLGFGGSYYLSKRYRVRSRWWTVLLAVVGLLLWKSLVVLGAAILFA